MTDRFVFESFGVVVSVVVEAPGDRHLADVVESILPPGRTDVRPATRPAVSLAVVRFGDQFSVYGPTDAPDGPDRADWDHEADALRDLDRRIRAAVSLGAPHHVFIHAGVVAGAAGALLLPGRSFAGKTTLVGALLSAGATYLSDEYAVLDSEGFVVPYPRPLSFRTAHGRSDVPARTLGPTAGPEPRPIALVVSTAHRSGATFSPSAGSATACAFALLDNAVAARSRSREVLGAVAAVGRRARYLEGERGEAAAAAVELLHLLGGPVARRARSGPRPSSRLQAIQP